MAQAAAAREFFLLGYLPAIVRGHLAGLDLAVLAKEPSLAPALEPHLVRLRERGTEIVSAVWEIENILARAFAMKPPPPPVPDNQTVWSQAVMVAAVEHAKADPALASYRDLGVWAGTIEVAVLFHARNQTLPVKELAERSALAVKAVSDIPVPKSTCPTARAEAEAIGRALEDATKDPTPALARIRRSARALESAALGTPRDSIRAWKEKRIDGTALVRRLAEHQSWLVQSRPDRDQPMIFSFDKRVMLGWSDPELVAARPDYLKEPTRFLSMPGSMFFAMVPNDAIDLVVLEGTTDASLVINYPREKHAVLKAAAEDAAFACELTNWSALDVGTLRKHRFWMLVHGGDMRNLVATDACGRRFAAIFSNEAALDAHLATTPAAAAADCTKVTLPGETFFKNLLSFDVAGIAIDPSGPSRSRLFNKAMLQRLA